MLEIITLLVSFVVSVIIGYYFKYICDSKLGDSLIAFKMVAPSKFDSSFVFDIVIPIILVSTLFVSLSFLTLIFQEYLPFNPNGNSNVGIIDAINLAVSFITTTNLQIVSAVGKLSYLSISILSFTTFIGSVIGISVAFVLIRSFAHNASQNSLGNFYNDALNITILLYLPACGLLAIFFVSQGVVQNFAGNISIITIDDFAQIIEQGPVASFLAIKVFGVNGGGFFASSSAHPFENPNELTNLVQIVSMLIIPSSLLVCYGLKYHTLRHATLYLAVFYCLLFISTSLVKNFEGDNVGNKELRFDTAGSSFYNTTSVISSGSSNSNLSKYTSSSHLVLAVNILAGNPIFGGSGVGFTNFMTMVILTVFLAGLMAGRAPVLYGKRIDSNEISYIVIYILMIQLCIFTGTILNASHEMFILQKLPETFFNLVSAANNNGSSFSISAENYFMINSTTCAMIIGRVAQLTVALGLANSLVAKRSVSNKLYDIRTDSPFFIILFMFVLIINLILYLPFLVIWPIVNIIGGI